MEGKTVYFTKPGPENTEDVLRIAKLRADDLGIKSILVASSTGYTAARATEICEGMKVIAVSRYTGFKEANTQEFTEENRQKVEDTGGAVLTTTHAFAGMSRAMRKKFSMYLLGEIIASTLRIFGDGTKVACEVALMAADAGLVRTDDDVISVGGTRQGADTAVVLKPVNSTDFFDLKVREILCKPRF
ncbi:pyruvate kinase alpha/beta domain-containing protein [Chloroflexota bacterium]